MFEQFLSHPFHIARHREGPYSEERQHYLASLIKEGRSIVLQLSPKLSAVSSCSASGPAAQ